MRARVNDRLTAAARFPVTLIVAPAGFGKSVALRDFTLTARIDALTLDVRREDDTLAAFAARLSETIAPVAPGAPASFAAIRRQIASSASAARDLAQWFHEHLRRAVCTIVIDDLHFAAADPSSVEMLANLIERTPDHVRWILAARSDLGLPVASWTAYGRMELPVGEPDLRFTPQEALAAAEEAQSGVDAGEVEELRRLTDGWAVALSIALRTRMYAADLRTAAASTREMLYRYLAEQVYAQLAQADRDFLLATCVFPSFNLEMARDVGARDESFGHIRHLAFVSEVSPGEYRYHDLFRDFLEATLRRGGEPVWHAALVRAGDVALRHGQPSLAIEQYTRAADGERLGLLLHTYGLQLFDRGKGDRIAQALAAIGEAASFADPVIAGLRAMLEAAQGRIDEADRAFDRAVAQAPDATLRALLLYRYALERVRHGRDCVPLLEPIAADPTIPAIQRPGILGTLASGYARAGRIAEALETIGLALEEIDDGAPEDVRARLFAQVADVYHHAGDSSALAYARRAVEIAESRNLYEIAARAYPFIYNDAVERDDPIAALKVLDRMAEAAIKAGSRQARLFANIAAYDLEAERGDEPRLEALEAELDSAERSAPVEYARAVVPARAMQHGWRGEFRAAYDLLRGAGVETASPDRELLRCAELALYAAAAGDREAAEHWGGRSNAILEHAEISGRRPVRARVLLAIAGLLRGQTSAAHHLIAAAERGAAGFSGRLRALVATARALQRSVVGQADAAAVSAALERLRAEHLGGYARLFAALPLSDAGSGSYASLTAAERDLLAELVSGKTTKELAGDTGRSPHTVDTHIRSICRKLGCRGRREAVALAMREGWV